ncbi:MAG: PrsW family intramembrane metalloprotease [Polyangiaceae bacterium]|nr:PrsW family intramembrane metalloprotease [Polyangiaceae bacterium]
MTPYGGGPPHPRHASAHPSHRPPGAFVHVAPSPLDPQPDRVRRRVGAVLYVLALLAGIVLNALFFILEIFASKRPPDVVAQAMLAGAVPAFAMLFVYLPVPSVLDRYDPEPWWCLLMAFAWGALVATGVAGFVNSFVHMFVANASGAKAGHLAAAVISAPISEEIMKSMIVWGFFFFLRREFDGVVDGIIYATFSALGFAAVENVSYYARAALEGQDVFAATFVLRGIVAPWGHPLYTSMTGIGIGLARESSSGLVRFFAPFGGLALAIALHAIWNFVPNLGANVFLVSLLFWFAFVGTFFVIVIALVIRKGRTIRNFLRDEIILGNITPAELALVTSAFGRARTYFMPKGSLWRRFIRAAARLALCKWHTARAIKGKKRTISIEFIAPLRDEMKRLRAEIYAR